MSIKTITNKDERKVFFYRSRQVAALSVLSAGSLAYMADNVEKVVGGLVPYVIGTATIGLILFFGLKR